jgi:hypothetical protein
MDPCAANPEVSDGNDAPGDHADSFASATAAIGTHTLRPDSGDYEMSYTVEKIAGPGSGPSPPGSTGVPSSSGGGDPGGGGHVVPPARPPGSGCTDVRAPRTLLTLRRLRFSRSGLSARGVASDRGCAGVARVSIALARHQGVATGRCRYLRPSGRLGPLTSCRLPAYVPAKGVRHWRFKLRHALPPGTYTLRSRAADRTGNVELKTRRHTRKRNFVTFKVR